MTFARHMDITFRGLDSMNFPRGFKVLDVGCGNPFSVTNSRNRFLERDMVWYGLDRGFKAEEVNLFQGDMIKMDMFKDNTFDLVFACHSFEHCERPVDALREFRRVLKDGGYLFLSMPEHCEKQIIGADSDHIFVMTKIQMKRLFSYTKYIVVDIWNENEYVNRPSLNSQIFVARKFDGKMEINEKVEKIEEKK